MGTWPWPPGQHGFLTKAALGGELSFQPGGAQSTCLQGAYHPVAAFLVLRKQSNLPGWALMSIWGKTAMMPHSSCILGAQFWEFHWLTRHFTALSLCTGSSRFWAFLHIPEAQLKALPLRGPHCYPLAELDCSLPGAPGLPQLPPRGADLVLLNSALHRGRLGSFLRISTFSVLPATEDLAVHEYSECL